MDTSVLGLDGLKLTVVDKSGMVIGELYIACYDSAHIYIRYMKLITGSCCYRIQDCGSLVSAMASSSFNSRSTFAQKQPTRVSTQHVQGVESEASMTRLTYSSSMFHRILLKLAVGFFFCCDTTWNSLFVAAVYRQLVEVQPGTLEAYIPRKSACLPITANSFPRCWCSSQTLSTLATALYFACIPLVTPFNVAGVNSFLIFRYMRLTKRRLLW